MAQRPLAVPIPHAGAHRRGLGRLIPCRDVPNGNHALHRPHPRRHFLHARLTEVLGRFQVQYLFAGPEQHRDGPPPRELDDHPIEAGVAVRGEQVAVTHCPRGIAYHDHLDRPRPQDAGPDRLVRQGPQRPLDAVDAHCHFLPWPRPRRGPLAIRLPGRLLGAGQSGPLLGLGAPLPLLGLGHLRVVDGRIAAHPADERHLRWQVVQPFPAGVGPVGDGGNATVGEPSAELRQHRLGQLGTARLIFARPVQAGQHRQGQNRDGRERHADGQRQDDPVMAAGGGDPLLGAGHGVAEPAQAPDRPAALVGQGIVDQDRQAAQGLQAADDEQGHLIGQALGGPSRTFKEVVVAVQSVTLGVIGAVTRVGRVAHPPEGVLAQAQDPAEYDLLLMSTFCGPTLQGSTLAVPERASRCLRRCSNAMRTLSPSRSASPCPAACSPPPKPSASSTPTARRCRSAPPATPARGRSPRATRPPTARPSSPATSTRRPRAGPPSAPSNATPVSSWPPPPASLRWSATSTPRWPGHGSSPTWKPTTAARPRSTWCSGWPTPSAAWPRPRRSPGTTPPPSWRSRSAPSAWASMGLVCCWSRRATDRPWSAPSACMTGTGSGCTPPTWQPPRSTARRRSNSGWGGRSSTSKGCTPAPARRRWRTGPRTTGTS